MVRSQCVVAFVDRTIHIFNVLYSAVLILFLMAVGHSSSIHPDRGDLLKPHLYGLE